MANRITRKHVVFENPFTLDSFDEEWAAGSCLVETEDEQLESMSLLAYRHIRTTMAVRPLASQGWNTRIIEVDPMELEEALARDRAPVERGENEGMKTS